MTIIQIASKYEVDPRSVRRWLKAGCPCTYEHKKPLCPPVVNLNPEEVEAWLTARRAQKGIAPAAQKGGEV